MTELPEIVDGLWSGALRVKRGKKSAFGVYTLEEIWEIVEPLTSTASPQQAQMLQLRYRQGLTLAEIAHILGVTRGHVSTQIQRWRTKNGPKL